MASSREITTRFEDAQDRLVLQASDLSLEAVAGMVDAEAIDIKPEFQRRERWTNRQASALIESFLLNIPVPPVYLAEEDYGRYAVIDGKQRLGAIRDFIKGDLVLSGLSRFSEIDGMRFRDLPPALRNALQVRPYLRVVTLLRQSDAAVKYEVFHRLNSGGEPLNAQEIRNVIFRGALNDLVLDLSLHPFLRAQLKIKDHRSQAYRAMQDVEYVLRFLTLRESWANFGGDFRTAMDNFMAAHTEVSGSTLTELRNAFVESITACQAVWGPVAFRRFDRGQWRDQLLGGMYDAQMIAIDSFDRSEKAALAKRSANVVQLTQQLFSDPSFDTAVRTSTNTPSRLLYRVTAMTQALEELLAKP